LKHSIVGLAFLAAALLQHAPPLTAQIDLPPARGAVNDFADVIAPDRAVQIESILRQVKARSGREIVVVTLPSLEGSTRDEVALQIGREWGVGGGPEVDDTLRGTGTVLLVVPSEHQWKIELGTRTATFISDAEAARIGQDAMVPHFRAGDFGTGILRGVEEVAARYATHYGFALDAPSQASIPYAVLPPEPAFAPEKPNHHPLGWAMLFLAAFTGAVILLRRRETGGDRMHFAPRAPRLAVGPLSPFPRRRPVGIRRLADRQSVGAEWLISPDFEFGFGSSASAWDSSERHRTGGWSGGDTDSGGSTGSSGGGGFSGDGAGGSW